ncbi:16S rRNA (cytosine(1402)-N(4))-methyltransferase RsmH [Legionella sp. W05-934-2]|jgi:16S rRNA (cytosine1402-N4)-methyltransferase|uniref:16S rRNA (cytosine(1402)-N(4))-methyltransferase RsmH n=1 Tax=Legionella sp. W05-934-2 TaxID=1198649 RepID=UPI0034636523
MSEHQTVLLNEAVAGLAVDADGIYVDGTFGRGGHSQAILSQLSDKGRLFAIDKDWQAISYAEELINDSRFTMIQGSFADIKILAEQYELMGKVNGILLDLGISSPQVDNPERGFSFMHDGPLDMRMDTKQPMDAKTFIMGSDEKTMAYVFKTYGEERFAKRIANAIVAARKIRPIETTLQLAEIVKAANPKWEKHKHPATRVFQAIRIHINQEISDLEQFLKHVLDVLTIGGRLAIISFHSLEDRVVKQFMRSMSEGPHLPRDVPVMTKDIIVPFRRIGKAIKASDVEIKHNPRARSAVLRIGEKVA